MENFIGELFLKALRKGPATFSQIVSHIADKTAVPPHNIRESVQEALNEAVRCGFIQHVDRWYYVDPIIVVEAAAAAGISRATLRR